MFVSAKGLHPAPYGDTGPGDRKYSYELRLEIGVKEETGTVPVAAIFRDLVVKLREVAGPDNPVVIITTDDKLFMATTEFSAEEFQQAFCIDTVQGKVSKAILGFKLRTMVPLSSLKQRLMKTYLMPHNLYLR